MTDESRNIIVAYQNCFSNDNGKVVLADLRRVFKFDLSVVPIGEDAHIDVNRLIRNEGQRSVLIHILTQMSKDTTEAKTVTEPERNYIGDEK